MIERVQRTDNTNYEVNASYNRAGAMLTETYPANPSTTTRRVVTHTFDGAGRLRSLSTAGASVANISYASHGALESQNYGTLLHQISYNNRLQPTQIKLEKTTDPTIVPLNISYGYGTTTNNGNVLSSTITAGADIWTQTFTYDALNRLDTAKEVKSAATQWSQNFDYDQYGNRCIRVNASTSCTPDISPANNNRLNGVSYDAAGNQTSMVRGTETLTLTYDAENHVKAVGADTAYVYDGEGKRVSKLMGENVRMVYGVTGELIAEFDGANGELKKEYIYGASGLAATIAAGEGTRYVTSDHLGTPRIVTSTTGAVVSRHDYQPFGEELFAGMGSRTTAQGYSNPVDSLRQKFTGYERDNETGLDYAQARYYSSIQGRFTSPDPLLSSARTIIPQSLNRYVYCLNNPLLLIDPTGLDWGYRQYPVGDGQSIREFKWFNGAVEKGYTPYNDYTYTFGNGNVAWLGNDGSWGWVDPIRAEPEADSDLNTFAQGVVTELSIRNENFGSNLLSLYGQSVAAGLTLGTSTAPLLVGAAMEAAVVLKDNGVDPVNPTIAGNTEGSTPATEPYKRPSGATTSAQRQAVQGQPCVDCGQVAPKMVADHKDPLVIEYYRTGKIDRTRMKQLDAVQPQCPTCSAGQGGRLRAFSLRMRAKIK